MVASFAVLAALLQCVRAGNQTCPALESEEHPLLQIAGGHGLREASFKTSGACSSPAEAAALQSLQESLLQQRSHYSIKSDLTDAFEYVTEDVQTSYAKAEEGTDSSSKEEGKTSWLQRLVKVGECVTEVVVGEIPALAEKGIKRFVSGSTMASVLGCIASACSRCVLIVLHGFVLIGCF